MGESEMTASFCSSVLYVENSSSEQSICKSSGYYTTNSQAKKPSFICLFMALGESSQVNAAMTSYSHVKIKY